MKKLIFSIIGMICVINLAAADDLVLPPKLDLMRYIAGDIKVDLNSDYRAKSDIRIWGWSRTGKIAISEEETTVLGLQFIDYYILDLTNDEKVFSLLVYSHRWEEQFLSNISEQGIAVLYNLHKDAISNANARHGIIYSHASLLSFPLYHLSGGFYDLYDCRANVYSVYPWLTYDIVIIRNQRRTKIINSNSIGESDTNYWVNMHICGYIMSPFENRIVVIAALERAGNGEGLVWEFVGCNLDVGFD